MKLVLNVSLNTERDADIVAWLDAQTNQSEAVRAAIRAHLAGAGSQSPDVTLADVLDAIHDLKRAGLAAPSDLVPAADEPADIAAALDGLGR